MTNYKIVESNQLDADLKLLADRLRIKGNTDDKLSFPEGFIGAINALETGSGTNKLAQLADDSITTITVEDLEGAISIRALAFARCNNLISVTIPESVEDIGEYAFQECHNLEILNLPENLFHIGFQMCENCSKLKKINLSGNIYSISDSCFQGCKSLTEIMLGEGISEIDSLAFNNCINLENIIFPSSLYKIDYGAFSYCTNLRHITLLGETPPIINANTFWNCPLTKITVPIGTGEYYKSSTNWADFADIIEEVAE